MASRPARDTIPHDILEAAQAAGLGEPLLYVGRTNGHRAQPGEPNVDDVMQTARDVAANQPPAPSPRPQADS